MINAKELGLPEYAIGLEHCGFSLGIWEDTKKEIERNPENIQAQKWFEQQQEILDAVEVFIDDNDELLIYFNGKLQ